MKIYLKRGRMLKGPGDRFYKNSSTEEIRIKKVFPAQKLEKVGCGEPKKSCNRYKMHIETIPFKKTVYECDVVPCNADVNVVKAERWQKNMGTCKPCD